MINRLKQAIFPSPFHGEPLAHALREGWPVLGKDDDNKEIEILLGALVMQEWGIRLNLEDEKLDMTHYPKEFVEF